MASLSMSSTASNFGELTDARNRLNVRCRRTRGRDDVARVLPPSGADLVRANSRLGAPGRVGDPRHPRARIGPRNTGGELPPGGMGGAHPRFRGPARALGGVGRITSHHAAAQRAGVGGGGVARLTLLTPPRLHRQPYYSMESTM